MKDSWRTSLSATPSLALLSMSGSVCARITGGERGCANYSALVLFRTQSVPVSGRTAAAAVSELARGCRWKCWCVLLFLVVRCPGGRGIFGRDRAGLLGGGSGGGAVPRGFFLAESFFQNAMWPSLPHGAARILRGWGIADSTRLSDGHRHEHTDWCLWWLPVFLAIFCTWREGLLMACHALKFYNRLIQTSAKS